jgi:hypothetical protein
MVIRSDRSMGATIGETAIVVLEPAPRFKEMRARRRVRPPSLLAMPARLACALLV